MKLLRLVPPNTKVPFLKYARAAMIGSIVAFLASIVLFFAVGLNLGIDFRGGTLIQLQTADKSPAEIGSLRSQVGALGLGDVQIQEFGAVDEVLIRVELQPGGDDAQKDIVSKIKQAVGEGYVVRRDELVGPTVSGELARDGTIAVIADIIAILIYIWFRFEWQQ